MKNEDEIYDDVFLSLKSKLLWILGLFIVTELRRMRVLDIGSYGLSGLVDRRLEASYYKLSDLIVWIGIYTSKQYGNFTIRSIGDEAIY